jgi:hypothetical protein
MPIAAAGEALHVVSLYVRGDRDELHYAVGTPDTEWKRSAIAPARTFVPLLAVDPEGGAHVLYTHNSVLRYASRGPCADRPTPDGGSQGGAPGSTKRE